MSVSLSAEYGSAAAQVDPLLLLIPMQVHKTEAFHRMAQSATPVFLTGETGTGKEITARLIHGISPRRNHPFKPVNCAAVPEGLFESIFFGHVKGAFTNATSNIPGCFQEAHKGTLFLDEVTEMPLPLQAKLLRALEDKNVTPLGAQRAIQTDVRIIAASNRDPEIAIKQGKLREDLYYRLNVLPIKLPLLRERQNAIIELAKFHISKATLKHQSDSLQLHPDKQLTDVAELALLEYSWPGNIRELRNVIEYAVIVSGAEDTIDIIHLPADLQSEVYQKLQSENPRALAAIKSAIFGGLSRNIDYTRARSAFSLMPPPVRSNSGNAISLPIGSTSAAEMEKAFILSTMEFTQGKVTKAAKILGITRSTLGVKLKKYNKSPETAIPKPV